MRLTLLVALFIFPGGILIAQQFQNGDLEGKIHGESSLPASWNAVPFGDPDCKASAANQATPDLTNAEQTDPKFGIAGKPFSGETFVSGVYSYFGGIFYQEGIMQKVSGFLPGHFYEIDFYQADVKQDNCRDTSGCWIVYVDSTLAGISAPSVSHLAFDDVNLHWEKRSVAFEATNSVHWIKFLPADDDNDLLCFDTDENGALRMGIDSIGLVPLMPESIYILPNPVSGYISIFNAGNDQAAFNMCDVAGNLLFKSNVLEKGLNEVDMEKQPPGIYIMEFIVDEKTYTVNYEKK